MRAVRRRRGDLRLPRSRGLARQAGPRDLSRAAHPARTLVRGDRADPAESEVGREGPPLGLRGTSRRRRHLEGEVLRRHPLHDDEVAAGPRLRRRVQHHDRQESDLAHHRYRRRQHRTLSSVVSVVDARVGA
ncbi:hypothetical protein DVB87_24835 [Tsukamurella tyrosinosolvens]|nr:hypothetical protein DVB87_24835 [Tsukamurella tyrosinosolvens]